MKKLIFFSLLLLSSLSYGQNFPFSNLELLIGKDLKVREKPESLQKYGYKDFYTTDMLKVKFDAGLSDANSRYESLVGKVFRMLDYRLYVDKRGFKKYIVKIENPETGILFYDYDPRFEEDFEFVVIGGIKYPDGFFDQFVKNYRDKFKDEKTYASPVGCDKVAFLKVVSTRYAFFTGKKITKSKIYLQISELGNDYKMSSEGVSILLENDLRIDIPRSELRVETNSNSAGFYYTAFIELSAENIKLLSENKMTDFRLYLYDREVQTPYTLREYIKSIAKMGEPVTPKVDKKVEKKIEPEDNPKDKSKKGGKNDKNSKNSKNNNSKSKTKSKK